MRHSQILCLTLVTSLLCVSAAAAQNVQNIPYSELLFRLERLERGASEPIVWIPSETACSYWYAGYDNVVVQPYFGRNIAFRDNQLANNVTSINTSFDWDLKYSPRIFLGYTTPCGTGVQLKYWSFDHSTRLTRTEQAGENLQVEVHINEIPMFLDVAGGTLIASHSIDLEVWDLEITRQADFCWGWLKGTGGVRYLRIDQLGQWNRTGSAVFVNFAHDFEGIGPTLSLESGVPLFGSRFSTFVNGRGSLLFGDRSVRALDEDPQNDELILSYDALLPILEAQFGLDWTTNLNSFVLSIRAALEGQAWFGGGSVSANPGQGIPGDQVNMGFFGGSFSAVLAY